MVALNIHLAWSTQSVGSIDWPHFPVLLFCYVYHNVILRHGGGGAKVNLNNV